MDGLKGQCPLNGCTIPSSGAHVQKCPDTCGAEHGGRRGQSTLLGQDWGDQFPAWPLRPWFGASGMVNVFFRWLC